MLIMARRGLPVLLCAAVWLLAGRARAGYEQVGLPLKQLPQDHAYQQEHRAFLGTLSEN